MQEGLSYLAGAELPAVVVDIMRGGPGLGNIGPEQADYFQIVKGGGHGCYHNIVLAPASAQEMCDLTMLAFELADKYRNPAIVLSDGYVGQMIEAVDFPTEVRQPSPKPWSVGGTAETRKNLVTSIYIYPPELEAHIIELQKKYREVAANEIRWDSYRLEGAEMILVGYGISSRVLRSTIDLAREEGIPAGLFRPISLWPYPSEALRDVAAGAKQMLVVELSNGQMLEDVRLAVEGRCPIEFYGRAGGIVPSHEEVLEQVKCLWALPGRILRPCRWDRAEPRGGTGAGQVPVGGGPCPFRYMTVRRRSTTSSSASPGISRPPTTAPAAAMGTSTSSWRRPSTIWGSRTGSSW